MSNYKPTEHDGLTESGEPDKRVGTGEFAHGKVDPQEAGKKGGLTSGSGEPDDIDESDDIGETGDSSSDSGTSGKGQFAGGKVDPVEAGRKGGKSS